MASNPAHDWQVVRLGDVCHVDWGNTSLTKALYSQSGFPAYSATGQDGLIPFFEHDEQALIVSAIGARCGKCFLARGKWTAIKNTIVVKSKEKGLADEGFLFYLLDDETKWPRSGTGQPFIGIGKAQTIEISLPPFSEQRAIARALDVVQKAKEGRQRELALERERKAALMEYLFTHGTHGEPTKQTEIGEIPESWQVLPLEDVALIERGKFAHRPRNAPEFYGGNIPFIQTGDVANSHGHIRTYSQTLNERGLSISRIFPKGTIVITIAANIGFTGILDFDSAFPDSLIGITPKEAILPEYLNYYLVTQQSEMDRKAPRGTQKNINIEFLKPWPVLVPPLEEQATVSHVLQGCDARLGGLQGEAVLLEELFRAMLEELMTGRLSAVPLIEEHQPQ